MTTGEFTGLGPSWTALLQDLHELADAGALADIRALVAERLIQVRNGGSGSGEFPGSSTDTGLRAGTGEDWAVPCNAPPKPGFDDWFESLSDKAKAGVSYGLCKVAWMDSRKRHTASLRRIGWLDRRGRVWLEPPAGAPKAEFTPLLIDAREDRP